jgi:catechol 2,3-dioxygenase-like lactoylglutathione lyase family enzyme
MRFGYTILYVQDLAATLAFYEKAFGLARKLYMEGEYGELDTGATTLSFAPRGRAAELTGLPVAESNDRPPPVEIAFVTDDVPAAVERALAAGAAKVKAAQEKPWGQTVAYVRDPNDFLIEICTPVTG